MEWKKASYGKTASKSGGRKLEPVMTAGNKGIPSGGSYPGKSQLGKTKGNIDTPMTKGNKGVTTQKGFPKSPAKFD